MPDRIFLRDRREAAGFRRGREVSDRSRTGRIICSFTNISMAITAPGLAPVIRRAGPGLVGTLITLFGQLNEKDWLESGIAFGVKQDKVLAVNNAVEESVAKATVTANSER